MQSPPTTTDLNETQQQTVVNIPLISTDGKQHYSSNNKLNDNVTTNNHHTTVAALQLPTLKMLSKQQVDERIKETQKAFLTNKTKDVKFRKHQLKQLAKMVEENTDLICTALKADLNKHNFETKLCELALLKNELLEFDWEIDRYASPMSKGKTGLTMFDDVYVQHEPLGTVLIMGAWNYPVLLALSPLAGAIAAGNCAVLKLSEHAPKTGAVLAELADKYLDKECFTFINCDLNTSKYLLNEHKYDHIFYTGGENGGRAIHQAAANSLTPVVLELGGKSPVYIDDECADNEKVWARLFWGKFVNAGQTCVAPDYVLCSEKVQQAAKKHFHSILKQFYDNKPAESEYYTRIVNANHFERLKKLIKNSTNVVVGGKIDKERLVVEPAILLDVASEDNIMQEEIFGPILPFVTCSSFQKAIDFINSRPKPLALYVFSNSKKVQQQFLHRTSSGGVCINDTLLQISSVSLPFGGVGNSGFGNYHGTYSIEAFSHKKAVLNRGFNSLVDIIGKMRYPPYNNSLNLTTLIQLGMNRRFYTPGPIMSSCIGFVGGAATVFGYQFIQTLNLF